jgi:hypothetical protein
LTNDLLTHASGTFLLHGTLGDISRNKFKDSRFPFSGGYSEVPLHQAAQMKVYQFFLGLSALIAFEEASCGGNLGRCLKGSEATAIPYCSSVFGGWISASDRFFPKFLATVNFSRDLLLYLYESSLSKTLFFWIPALW